MFGMSDNEFWEQEPQLYWAYHFSYEKKLEFEQKAKMEQIKFGSWLQGIATERAVSIALHNAFSKGRRMTFPKYEEMFGKDQNNPETANKRELEQLLENATSEEERGMIEFNYWARI